MATWNPLRGWLTPRWQHADPAVRRRAAMELAADDPEADRILSALAEDDAAEVREAALKRVNDIGLLRRHLREDPAPVARTAASVRYRQVLIGTLGTSDAIEELDRCPDATVIGHVARRARQPSVRRAALDRVDTETLLIEAALHDDDAEVRLHALGRLEDRPALQRLLDEASVLSDESGPVRTDVIRQAQQRLEALQAGSDPASGSRRSGETEAEIPEAPARAGRADRDDAADGEPSRIPRTPAPSLPRARPATETGSAAGTGTGSPPAAAHGERILAEYRTLVEEGRHDPGPDLHARRRSQLQAAYRSGLAPASRARLRELTAKALTAPDPPRPEAVSDYHQRLHAVRDPARALLEWLPQCTRPGGALRGAHPQEAQLRRSFQVRIRERVNPPGVRMEPARATGGTLRLSSDLKELLEAAEQAVATGDLAGARERIARALALTEPAADGTAGPQS